MAKGTYRDTIGPDDPIWTEGWTISNPKKHTEPKPIKLSRRLPDTSYGSSNNNTPIARGGKK